MPVVVHIVDPRSCCERYRPIVMFISDFAGERYRSVIDKAYPQIVLRCLACSFPLPARSDGLPMLKASLLCPLQALIVCYLLALRQPTTAVTPATEVARACLHDGDYQSSDALRDNNDWIARPWDRMTGFRPDVQHSHAAN
jgi:hypothetical protein